MRQILRILFGLAALAGLGAVLLAVWPIGDSPELAAQDGDAQRGAYLARAGGCIACHSGAGDYVFTSDHLSMDTQ